jgi:hypothetical protein
VLTNATQEGSPGFMSCNVPEGFKGGNFSSVIELFSEQDSCPPAHVAGTPERRSAPLAAGSLPRR